MRAAKSAGENFFKLSPRRTQGREGEEREGGKNGSRSARCPPTRRKERIDTNEGKGSNLLGEHMAGKGNGGCAGRSDNCAILPELYCTKACKDVFTKPTNNYREWCRGNCALLCFTTLRAFLCAILSTGRGGGRRGFWQARRFVEHEQAFLDRLKSAASLHNSTATLQRTKGEKTFQ